MQSRKNHPLLVCGGRMNKNPPHNLGATYYWPY